jgi:PAS domain-containing protein
MRHEHETTIEEVRKQFGVILKESKQPIYVYLDDTHKLCNERFASMLGYESAEEWSSVTKPFTDVFVREKSRHPLVSAFQEAMEFKSASIIHVAWKKKAGGSINTQAILVPISVKGELLALHYITEV